MLRTVFIGSRSRFDELLVHWLAQRTELAGVVWLNASAWKRTRRAQLEFARRRLRRRGPLKTLDEMAFYLYFHRRLMAEETRRLERAVIEPYVAEHGPLGWTGKKTRAADVNDPKVVGFIRRRKPDVAFAVCVPARFSEEVFSVPRLGTFLWHEGITPEYRGLYAPFWAAHELDFGNLGATLLRMNERLDGGEVFVQTPVRDVDPRTQHHVSIGHKAIWDSLPEVERLLGELEAGTARPIARDGAQDRYFTYPGLTDYVRQRGRLRRGY